VGLREGTHAALWFWMFVQEGIVSGYGGVYLFPREMGSEVQRDYVDERGEIQGMQSQRKKGTVEIVGLDVGTRQFEQDLFVNLGFVYNLVISHEEGLV
jgi:hypothetical protein